MSSQFSERLNHLRRQMRPAGRAEPLNPREISEGVFRVTGEKVSASAIAYYISGERQPSLGTAHLLARFFGVPTSYWTDDDVSAVDADLATFQRIKATRAANVEHVSARLGSFAANLEHLSAEDLEMLSAILDRFAAERGAKEVGNNERSR